MNKAQQLLRDLNIFPKIIIINNNGLTYKPFVSKRYWLGLVSEAERDAKFLPNFRKNTYQLTDSSMQGTLGQWEENVEYKKYTTQATYEIDKNRNHFTYGFWICLENISTLVDEGVISIL